MVEIAISLAIIGIALVGILSVLPLGLNVQRDNREGTIINQDATVFMEAIRNGAHGADDLTNYVYAISNTYNTAFGIAGSANITSGAQIVGLLSTPEFVNGYSNRIVAYVHCISGLAVEKPPQDNSLVVGDSFTYRIVCQNIPVQSADDSGYGNQLTNNLHELRLTFLWPQRPNGSLGAGHQTFRALIAGQLVQTNSGAYTFYFFQPQSFTNAP